MYKLYPEIFFIVLLIPALIFAAVYDIRYQKIPNRLNFPLAGLGLVFHLFFAGLEGFVFSGAGLLLGTAIFLPPYILGGMGAGDAKLMGAVGAVVGAKGVFISALFTAVYGGVYALLLLAIYREYSRALLSQTWQTFMTFVLIRQYVPKPKADSALKSPRLCYGLAIALGTMTYLLFTHLGIDFLGA